MYYPTGKYSPIQVKELFILTGLPSNSSIKIYDGLGRMVYSVNQTNEKQVIDLSSFKSGLYYLQSEIDGKTSTMKKIVLNR